jgi:hypothetical protein
LISVLTLSFAGIGGSELAAGITPVRPVIAPGAPLQLGAVGVRDGLTATWLPPAGDGGSAIIRFTATVQPGDRTCSSAGDACTVRGLVDGHRYHLIVRDDTSFGASAPATELVAAGPVPTRPTVVRARDVHGVVEISWRRATAPRDEPIRYVVTLKGPRDGERQFGRRSLRCRIGGLPKGKYAISVTAFDPSGGSKQSSIAQIHVS